VGEPGFDLRAEINARDGAKEVAVAFGPPLGKRAAVNDERLPRLADFVGTLAAVAFVPEDMELAQGEPAVRRRFLDMWLGQESREYLYALQRYGDVLVRRNALLARFASRREREPYDYELVQAGAALTASRARAAAALAPAAARAYGELAPAAETFAVTYTASVNPASDDPGEVAAAFEEALARTRADEEERRTTLVGPHRDDLALTVQGRDARRFASEGQQRTVALALRLAQHRLQAAKRGDAPVLLLDDVFSALDAGRQERLFGAVAGATQVWVTAAVPPSALRPDAEFYIAGGEITTGS
jgi:DNA replication and repair protein RecF